MSHRNVEDWLHGFKFYTSESECPDNYLLWTALTTISAALQRRVYTKWIYYNFFPNIYVILVGPPGVTHKSSSIKFGRNMLKEINVSVGSEAITKEALIQQMRNRGSGGNDALAVMSSEFGSFIAPSGIRMVEFLTDIYDCEANWEYTIKHGGTERIERPYLSLLGGTTPAWIAQEFTDAFVEGGFAARALFVSETVPRFRKAFATITPAMYAMRERLVEDLVQIADLEGEYTWTDEARDWFEHWYEELWPDEVIDYRCSGYLNRKPTHVIRISMLVAASKSNELVLNKDHFQSAERLLTGLEPKMVKAFASVGRNPYASDLERMSVDISDAGSISRSDFIARNVHAMDKKTMDENIETLIAMGKIGKELRVGEVWYYAID